MLYVLFVALIYHISNLWQLWLSFDDVTPLKSLSDLPMVGGITRGTGTDNKSVGRAATEIENIAKGSFFSFSVFPAATGDVMNENADSDGNIRSLPTLAQIDQASVVLKRGTRVYLDYLRPLSVPKRDEYTLVVAATVADLRNIFSQGGPPWDGPISCAIQVSQISEDIAAISAILNENPTAFKHTSIHLLLSEAMLVVDWSSVWIVGLKGARTDLVMVLPKPSSLFSRQLSEIADTVKEHYSIRLKLEKSIIRLNSEDKSDSALLLSKRGGLLPMIKYSIKTKGGINNAWTKQLEGLEFVVEHVTWQSLASQDDSAHQRKDEPALLEMGSMLVVGLDTTIRGSVKVGKNMKAFTNFITPRYKPDHDEVCVVTQMAFNKRERLVKLATAWGGVMSVAVFLSLDEVEALVRFVRNNHMALSYTYIHVVIHEEFDFYPINIMRNVATNAAETDFIFTVDLDFMPSLAAHNVIRSYISHPFWGNQIRNTRIAMIIPAFEYTVTGLSDSDMFGSLPLTKAEVVRSKDAIPFHIKWFFKGHKPTDFKRWYKTDEPYEVRYEEGFEPYVVMCSRGHSLVPQYWEGFKGYKLNKLSWIRELDRAGWSFYVLPGEAFLTHMSHDISNRPEMPGLEKEKEKFESHLKETYAG